MNRLDINKIGDLVKDGLFPNPIAMLIQLLATAILFFFIYKFAYKPVMKMLKQRQDLIDKEINEAKEANETAKNTNLEAEKNIADAREKAEVIVTNATVDANTKSNEIVENARKEANYKLQKAEEEISKKVKEAKAELKEEVAKNSVFIAEKVINSEIDSDKHQDLIDEAISEVNN